MLFRHSIPSNPIDQLTVFLQLSSDFTNVNNKKLCSEVLTKKEAFIKANEIYKLLKEINSEDAVMIVEHVLCHQEAEIRGLRWQKTNLSIERNCYHLNANPDNLWIAYKEISDRLDNLLQACVEIDMSKIKKEELNKLIFVPNQQKEAEEKPRYRR